MDPGAVYGQILVANPGSTSRKYALYQGETPVFSLAFRQHADAVEYKAIAGERSFSGKLDGVHLENALAAFLRESPAGMSIPVSVDAVALRVVAGGVAFQHHGPVDEEYIRELEKQQKLLPLHAGSTLEDYRALKANFPEARFIGISDSAFHTTQPAPARFYGLNTGLAAEQGLQRFGYHGIAAASVVERLSRHYLVDARKLVLCHLGGGTSIMAIKNGRSLYTSMGFSPLEGPMMVTRSGDLDPAVAASLLGSVFPTPDELIGYLNTQCGVKGWTGTADVRELMQRCEAGDPRAVAAVDKYVHDVLKYIGIAFMALEGMDAVVFSGGIGEHAVLIRNKILKGLEFLGFKPREEAQVLDERCYELAASGSAIHAFVVKVDEEYTMLKLSLAFL